VYRAATVDGSKGLRVVSRGMNTPRTKPPKRHGEGRKTKPGPPAPDGHYESSLFKAESHAMRLGQLVVYRTWVEEQLIDFLGLLLGDRQLPSRQIFRAIKGERVRIEVLAALLGHARQNKDKGPEYDRVIHLQVEVGAALRVVEAIRPRSRLAEPPAFRTYASRLESLPPGITRPLPCTNHMPWT
jgi:hypothetical protein